MKTKGMAHQMEARRHAIGRAVFAYFMEQGTGKTWTVLAEAEECYIGGKIDALFVLAPKGVHTNWTLREIPTHLDVPTIAHAWRAGMGKKARAEIEKLLQPRADGAIVPLRILSMNIDAISTKDGFEFALKFLRSTKALMAVDESSRIKNLDALRTKRAMLLRRHAKIVRIMSGTPITNAPLDIFAQFEFMESGLLGTTSYRAFVAEYADVLPPDHPLMQNLIEKNPRAARAQIVARNADGSPRYRNLDRLQALVAKHSYRVLKKDCLDLPEKIYKQTFFQLTPKQQATYETLERDLRIHLDNGEVHTVQALAALVKLQQITSGYVNIETQPQLIAAGENPRMDALMEIVEDIPGKFIVWARFREELRQIAEEFAKAGIKCVEYHGGVSAKDRELAVDEFQNGDAVAFIGQPQSGGIGLTLTAAENVVYYSNDFNMETRAQSEDRCHRIGTKVNVVYTDIIAVGTIDEPISRALQRKKSVAAAILGDRNLDFSKLPAPSGLEGELMRTGFAPEIAESIAADFARWGVDSIRVGSNSLSTRRDQ